MLIEENEARQRIFSRIAPCEAREDVSLAEALGRIVATDWVGLVDLPGFDNSAMDGYAVRAVEAVTGAVLQVRGEQAAGIDLGQELGRGEAIRIFTGAPIPRGADAVVMQEDVSREADSDRIEIREGVEPGEWIRRRGADVCVGQRLIGAGTELTPGRIGLLASQGCGRVAVRPRPRVGIVTTGDEVVEASADGTPMLAAGQLYNSNGPMLAALASRAGAVVRRWHAPDEPGELTRVLAEALEASEFVVVAGGVSVGDRDFVKGCLAGLGVVADFWRVRLKPGKPFLFGTREGGRPVHVFGLPGNPVSAFVTWHVFAAPALAYWQGGGGATEHGEALCLPRHWGRVDPRLENPGDRPHYLRVRIDPGTGDLAPTGLQQSHALFGLSGADALLRLEAGQTIEAGELAGAWRV